VWRVGKHTILAAAGSHRTVIGAESMFAKTGKHTLGWQTYSEVKGGRISFPDSSNPK
jgi:hypothetical protein